MGTMTIEVRRSFVSYPFSDNPKTRIVEARELCEEITNSTLSSVPGSILNELWTKVSGHYPATYSFEDPASRRNDHVIVRIPFSPHLIFPEYMCEDVVGREAAMAFCFSLLHACDDVLFGTNTLSQGMREELQEAIRIGKPIVFYDDIR